MDLRHRVGARLEVAVRPGAHARAKQSPALPGPARMPIGWDTPRNPGSSYPITCAKIARWPGIWAATNEPRAAGRCKGRRQHRSERQNEEAVMPGEIVHIEIPADDTTKSQQFWGSLFGWQFQANPGPFEYHTTQIAGE